MIGGFCAFQLVNLFVERAAVKSWPQVPVTVVSAELITVPSKRSKPTYRVDLAYSYQINGQSHVSNSLQRGYFVEWSDSDLEYHQTWLITLQDAKQGERQLQAFVNPANPKDAALDAEIRSLSILLLSVFAVAFGVPGLVLILLPWFLKTK